MKQCREALGLMYYEFVAHGINWQKLS